MHCPTSILLTIGEHEQMHDSWGGGGAEMMQLQGAALDQLRTFVGKVVHERRFIFSGAGMTDPADPGSDSADRRGSGSVAASRPTALLTPGLYQ